MSVQQYEETKREGVLNMVESVWCTVAVEEVVGGTGCESI